MGKDIEPLGYVLVSGSIKGGVGKSTLATNIYVELNKVGYSVCLVDADPQKTSLKWSECRSELENDKIDIKNGSVTVGLSGNIASNLKAMSTKYDFTVVDTAGRESKEFGSALIVADMLIVPSESSQFSLETMTELLDNLENKVVHNPSLKVLFYLTRLTNHHTSKIKKKKEFSEFINEVFEGSPINYKVMRANSHTREVYSNVVITGEGVTETTDDEKATSEVERLFNEIISNLEEDE